MVSGLFKNSSESSVHIITREQTDKLLRIGLMKSTKLAELATEILGLNSSRNPQEL